MVKAQETILKNAKKVFVDADYFKDDELILYYQICKLVYGEENLHNAKLLANKVEGYWELQSISTIAEVRAVIRFEEGDNTPIDLTLSRLLISKAQIERDVETFALGFKKYISSASHIKKYGDELKKKSKAIGETARKLERKADFLRYGNFEEVEEFELYNSLKTEGLDSESESALRELGVRTFKRFFDVKEKEIVSLYNVGEKTIKNILDKQDALKGKIIF